MRNDGFSLIELLVVLAFLGIILLIATPLTLENIRRARAENETQTLYTNLAEARQRAVQRNHNYLIQVKQTGIDIYEDTNDNGTADASEHMDQLSASGANLVYFLQGKVGSNPIGSGVQAATANRKGFVQPTMLIYIDKNSNGPGSPAGKAQESRHNCILADFTRVTIGNYDGTNCNIQ